MKEQAIAGAPLISLKYRVCAALLVLLTMLTGCQNQPDQVFQGYVEGEFVQVAAPLAGQLEKLAVQRGDQVNVGDPLFVLEQGKEQAAVAAAGQEVSRAKSRLADLRKGQRPSELEAARARREQARVAFQFSRQEYERRRALVAQKALAQEELDRAQAVLNRDRAVLTELDAQLETAGLGARSDAVAAAVAELEAARAKDDQVRWALEQKNQRAAVTGRVFDTLFVAGEFVPAGYPVVTLLPPGNIKIRFFVPAPLVGRLQVGQDVSVRVDGATEPLTATINYISPQVEYTPPVIYSRDTRAKLVFLIEARPAPTQAARLHPGQPVDVRLEARHDR